MITPEILFTIENTIRTLISRNVPTIKEPGTQKVRKTNAYICCLRRLLRSQLGQFLYEFEYGFLYPAISKDLAHIKDCKFKNTL